MLCCFENNHNLTWSSHSPAYIVWGSALVVSCPLLSHDFTEVLPHTVARQLSQVTKRLEIVASALMVGLPLRDICAAPRPESLLGLCVSLRSPISCQESPSFPP